MYTNGGRSDLSQPSRRVLNDHTVNSLRDGCANIRDRRPTSCLKPVRWLLASAPAEDELLVRGGDARSPGHAFYDKLQAILIGACFDRFVEAQCTVNHASRRGHPSLPPEHMQLTHAADGLLDGIDGDVNWNGGMRTTCLCVLTAPMVGRSRNRAMSGHAEVGYDCKRSGRSSSLR